jgi:hypothetical protein
MTAAADLTLPPDAKDPRFRELFAYWQNKAPPGRLPGRAHIDPLEIPRLLPHLALYDVVRAGEDFRFRFRLVGTGAAEALGADNTGKFIDEIMKPEPYTPLHASYATLVREHAPQYWQRNLPFDNRDFLAIRRLALPLAADGQNVDMVMSYYVPILRDDLLRPAPPSSPR